MTEQIDTNDSLDALDPDLSTLASDTRSRDAEDDAFGADASRRVLDKVRQTVHAAAPNEPGGEQNRAAKTSRLRAGALLASACVLVAFAGSKLLHEDREPASPIATATTEANAVQTPTERGPEAKLPPQTIAPRENIPMMHVDDLPSTASPAPPILAQQAQLPSRKAPATSDLPEEYRLIEGARAGLAAKDFESALRSLREHEARFPNGQLNQECESLHIQALVEAGRVAEARERASVFQTRFPNGLLLPFVARALAGSSADAAKP